MATATRRTLDPIATRETPLRAEPGGPAVLLVDDDLTFLRDLSALLTAHVGSVHSARTPLEALHALETADVDVVVCDLQLADSDGLHLLELIRAEWPTVARVLLTGFGDRLRGRQTSPAAQAVICKPCDASSLVTLLRALPLRNRAAGQPARTSGAALSWTTIRRSTGEVCVVLVGELNEQSDLRGISRLPDPLVLDLTGVRAINSAGMHQLARLLEDRPVVAEGCSSAVVKILNVLPALCRRIQVRSVVAPLECDRCRLKWSIVVEIGHERPPIVPDVPCPECPGAMTLAEPPEHYFGFLLAEGRA
jgi:ActR/RegA family two-component response regulator